MHPHVSVSVIVLFFFVRQDYGVKVEKVSYLPQVIILQYAQSIYRSIYNSLSHSAYNPFGDAG